jgi:hypothetical protein
MYPNPRRFALVGGIIMLAMGILAFVPGLNGSIEGLPALRLESSYGMFLGIFPMNILNKLVLILMGIWGVVAARNHETDLRNPILFCKTTFVIMGLLTIFGLFPATNTLGGYWPLFGNEIWAHALFAIVGAYFGFANKATAIADRRRDQKAA